MESKYKEDLSALIKRTKSYNNKIWKIAIDEIEKRFDDKSFKSILTYIPSARKGYVANRPYSAYLGYLYGGGNPKNKDILKLSAALEIMNTSITYIDDKIFDDDLYVGKKLSLHKRFELPLAIIASSTLRSISKSIISEIAPISTYKDIITEIDQISQEADYGQFLDVTYGHKFIATINDAVKINNLRTGQFIRRCAEIGYLFAGKSDEKERKYLYDSFKLYGRSVQDANDLDDVTFNEHSPDSYGMDIRLFKKTKPIVKAMELSNDKQLDILHKVLGNPNTNDELLLLGCKVIRDCGALEWTVQDIIKTIERAINIISDSNNLIADQIVEYFNVINHILKERYYEEN